MTQVTQRVIAEHCPRCAQAVEVIRTADPFKLAKRQAAVFDIAKHHMTLKAQLRFVDRVRERLGADE